MINNILHFSKWKDIKNENITLAVLPWGATEAHNLHLPYGTDTILAEYIAVNSVKKASELDSKDSESLNNYKMTVLPPIAYGVNTGQMDIKLCMNINPSTQLAILNDILQVLNYHNINRLVIINGHGGNIFQPIIRELSIKFPNILVSTINWWVVCKGENYFNEPGDHAGDLESSCMMAINPYIVLPLSQAGQGKERKLVAKGFREKWAWIPRKWIYATSDTGVGNPKESDATIGQKFLDDTVLKVAEFLNEFASAKNEKDLYEL